MFYYNGTWSALSEQNFIVPADFKDIKITEVHYHPVNHNEVQDSVLEFIELKNTGNPPFISKAFSLPKASGTGSLQNAI